MCIAAFVAVYVVQRFFATGSWNYNIWNEKIRFFLDFLFDFFLNQEFILRLANIFAVKLKDTNPHL